MYFLWKFSSLSAPTKIEALIFLDQIDTNTAHYFFFSEFPEESCQLLVARSEHCIYEATTCQLRVKRSLPGIEPMLHANASRDDLDHCVFGKPST